MRNQETGIGRATPTVGFEGVRLIRTGGQHGTDAMFVVEPVAALLGRPMGVVFQAEGAATVYVVGDTTWHGEVERARDS